VITARRTLAVVSIAVVLVAAATSAASELPAIVLVLLDPLFRSVVSVPVPETDAAPLRPAPVLSVRSLRGPPLA
jgi:hypothetical protein